MSSKVREKEKRAAREAELVREYQWTDCDTCGGSRRVDRAHAVSDCVRSLAGRLIKLTNEFERVRAGEDVR